MRTLKQHWTVILIGLFVLFSINTSSCSKKSELEEYREKREKILLEKLNKDVKLTFEELGSLIGLLASRKEYDKIIDILERLKDSPEYRDDRYMIYSELAVFYSIKAKQTASKNKQIRLIEKAIKYLDIGFNASPDRADAYLFRARIYKLMGCDKKAERAYNKAIDIAKTRKRILIGGQRYVTRKQFIQLAIKSMEWIRSDSVCILPVDDKE